MWINETTDLKERTKICVTLVCKLYKLYATVYTDKIDLLNEKIGNLNLELNKKRDEFNNKLDYLKQNQSNLILNLIDKSLLTIND